MIRRKIRHLGDLGFEFSTSLDTAEGVRVENTIREASSAAANFPLASMTRSASHLEVTRGNEICLEDTRDASRLNLSLAYEVHAECFNVSGCT